jgi:hypothetical protein
VEVLYSGLSNSSDSAPLLEGSGGYWTVTLAAAEALAVLGLAVRGDLYSWGVVVQVEWEPYLVGFV